MDIKEKDYIAITNRTKVNAALRILMDVLPGDKYGIDQKEFTEITKALAQLDMKLLSIISSTESEKSSNPPKQMPEECKEHIPNTLGHTDI